MKLASVLLLPAAAIILGGRSTEAQSIATGDLYNGLSTRVGSALPTSTLPSHVVAPAHELTFYADYLDVRGGYTVLYIVNHTENNLLFAVQDGDPYVKLEARNADGTWERTQRGGYSWCGNSFYHCILKSEHYFKFLGYFPPTGTPSKVRYRVYENKTITVISDEEAEAHPELGLYYEAWNYIRPKNRQQIDIELVSNTGDGRTPDGALEKARSDGMAFRHGTFEVVAQIARGEREISSHLPPNSERRKAIESLERFGGEKCLNLLRELSTDPEPHIRSSALSTLVKVAHKDPSGETIMEELLNSDDLATRCGAILAWSGLPASSDRIPRLKAWLQADEPAIRAVSLYALARHAQEDKEIHDILRSMLHDPDEDVRWVASWILDELDRPRSSTQPGS